MERQEHICFCNYCLETRRQNDEWESLLPVTNLQRRMVHVIARIEQRAKEEQRLNAILEEEDED